MKITIGKNTFEKEAVENAAPTAKAAEKSVAKRELKDGRSIYGRKFALGGGKVAVEYGGSPLFYRNGDGVLKKIDKTVVEKSNTFENKNNAFKTKFYKHSERGVLFEIEENKCKVTLISKDAAKCACGLNKCECAENNRVRLDNVKANVDLEYVLTEDRIKENIIINERSDKYEFDFEIDIDGLYVDVSEDGRRLELRRKESGAVQYYIPVPFMTDARGVFSESAYYEITKITSEKFGIKVVADANWINAENREFPVTIDPQIIVNRFEGSYVYYNAYTEDMRDIFRYETIHNGKVVAEALYVSCVDSYFLPQNIYESNLIINRSAVLANLSIPALINDIKKVTLRFTIENRGKMGDITVAGYWLENCSPGEHTVDITELFKSSGNSVVVPFRNVMNRGSGEEEYIFIVKPVLEMEIENNIIAIKMTQPPVKTTYYTGETFDPTGMVIGAVYEDGTERAVSNYNYSPKESLSSYDKGVTVTFDGKSLLLPGINIIPMTFNDRRPVKDMENVYRVYEVDIATGERLSTEKYVRIELCDGAEGNDAGTPLSAKYLNNIKVRAENIVGVINEKNLPDYLTKPLDTSEA